MTIHSAPAAAELASLRERKISELVVRNHHLACGIRVGSARRRVPTNLLLAPAARRVNRRHVPRFRAPGVYPMPSEGALRSVDRLTARCVLTEGTYPRAVKCLLDTHVWLWHLESPSKVASPDRAAREAAGEFLPRR